MKNIYLFRLIVLALCSIWAADCVSATNPIIARTDTVSVTIKADSITVQTDSLSMQADSLSMHTVADSTSVANKDSVNAIPDSLIIGYLPDSVTYKYLTVNERPKRECDMLKMLYKKGFDGVTPPSAVYDKWRIAFTSTADRSLDMYIDGMCILLSCVETDTIIHKRYDRLSRYRDELMELYDLAIENIGHLNTQIDREHTKDTLSVAKLRGMQLKYYVDLSIADSIHNSDTLLSKPEWQNRIFLDREHEMFMYPRYKEIVLSNDLNIDMIYLTYFIKSAEIKIGLDREIGLAQSTRQENFTKDCELAKTRADEILTWIDPYEMYNQEHTNYEVFSSQLITMDEIIRAGNRRFISNSDYPKLEEYYAEKFQKEGEDEKVLDEILNSPLANYIKSKTYVQVLRRKYEKEPTYDMARRITTRLSHKDNIKTSEGKVIKQNINDAIVFAKRAIEFNEFSQEKPFAQVTQYMNLVKLYSELGGNTKIRIGYIKQARKICPEYPETYFLEGDMIYKDKTKGRSAIGKKFVFCVAYDYFMMALKKLKELNSNPNTDVKSNLSEEDIKDYIERCKANFPSKEDVFMEGFDVNEPQQARFPFGTYKSKFKFSE